MTVTVVVPFRPGDPHRDRLWSWVGRWWRTWFPDYQITIGDTDYDEPFNRGAARNNAARAATGTVLIVADADTITDPHATRAAVACVELGMCGWAIPYREDRYYNLSEAATRRRLQFDPDRVAPITEPWDQDDWEFKLTSWAGCLVVPADAYWEAGGYPEFDTWGYEDDCFRHALDVTAGPHHRTDGFALHLWHPASEADRFGNPGITRNRAIADEYRRARTLDRMRAVISRHGASR